MSLTSGTKLGPYEILEPIGAGGMGEVYRARDGRLARDVAVKVLPESLQGDRERLARFAQEARAAGQLNHPNILAVYDFGTHEGVAYLVEELLEGETLRERLADGALPVRKAIDLARQIARGLAAAHAKGVVHRDLKPDNLFLTREGRVKILDFGLAKVLRPDPAATLASDTITQMKTETGIVLGTVGYMSPEQARGQAVDHRSDLFGFGEILYEMLAGRRPFGGDSALEVLNAILGDDPPPLCEERPQVPQALERIVCRCLEKVPEQRFQSASDLAFHLESLAGDSLSSSGRQPVVAPPRRLRRRAALAVAAVAVALAAVALAVWWSRPPPAAATYRRLTFRQGNLFSARFTPDASTVIYAASWEGGERAAFSTRIDSPGSFPIGLSDVEVLAVSPAGELAVLLGPHFTSGWMRDGTLARVPLAGGLPRPVLEHVLDATWTPDGEALAAVRFEGGRYRLEFPIGTPLFEATGWISSPRFSHDGERIAFLFHPFAGDNRGQVGIVDLGGRSELLTEPYSTAQGLAWSPGGDEIWFTAGSAGIVRALYAVDLAGRLRLVDGAPANLTLQDVAPTGDVLLVTSSMHRGFAGSGPDGIERNLSYLDWGRPSDLSSDGRQVLFEEQGQGGGSRYTVYVRGTDGSPPIRLGEGIASGFSPDGRWALTVTLAAPRKLFRVPLGPGEPQLVPLPEGLRLEYAGWFPDGERLALLAGEGDAPVRLWELEPGSESPRPLTPPGFDYYWAISPDGQRLYASSRDGELLDFPVRGGEPSGIPGTEPGDIPLRVSADGAALYVARTGTPPGAIDRIDLVTGRRVRLHELAPTDSAGLLDIGFVSVSADGSSYAYSYRRALSTLYLVHGLR